MYWYEDVDDSMYHFGIKGMKWGVRRSPEQLGHKTPRSAKKRNAEVRKKREEALAKAKTMSSDDLKKAVNRIELERKYQDLVGGKEERIGKSAAVVILGGIGTMLINRAAGKAFDEFVWDPMVRRRTPFVRR